MSLKTENLVIVLTDIAGYTEATEQKSRRESEEFLGNYSAILLPIIKRFKGRLIKTIGDALLMVFKSPTDAMICSMAMQDALFDYNRRLPTEKQIHIRVAASLGEVRVVREDIFGDAVNVTSRIESITPSDEIYFSEAVFLAMNKAEVPAKEVGWKKLKGISSEIRVYQIPRFSTVVLVPQNVMGSEDIGELTYPYGGAHFRGLTTPSSAAGRAFASLGTACSSVINHKHFKVGLVAVSALLAVAIVAPWSWRDRQKPSPAPVVAPGLTDRTVQPEAPLPPPVVGVPQPAGQSTSAPAGDAKPASTALPFTSRPPETVAPTSPAPAGPSSPAESAPVPTTPIPLATPAAIPAPEPVPPAAGMPVPAPGPVTLIPEPAAPSGRADFPAGTPQSPKSKTTRYPERKPSGSQMSPPAPVTLIPESVAPLEETLPPADEPPTPKSKAAKVRDTRPLEAEPSTRVVTPPPHPRQPRITGYQDAKSAYAGHAISAEEYKSTVSRLKAAHVREIEQLKEDYRSGRISKAEYSRRAADIKMRYR